MTYTLSGAPASLYTGKARAYLRKQGVDFVETTPGSDRYLQEIISVTGCWIIPVMETSDGRIIQVGAEPYLHGYGDHDGSLVEKPADRSLTGGRGMGGGVATFEWRGQQLTTGVLPYRLWLMQRLHDDLAAASTDDQDRVRGAFRRGDLEPLLDLRTLRRVERHGHLEVWGAS